MNSTRHILLALIIFASGITLAQTKSENVSKDNDNSNTEETLVSKFNKGVHVVAEVSDNEITLDDSLTITYKLYVSQDIGVSNYKVEKEGEHKGFEVEDIKLSNPKVEYELFKNETYRLVVFKTSILKPKQKGMFTLDALELNVTAEIGTKTVDDFGRLVMEKVNRTIKTDSIVINVI